MTWLLLHYQDKDLLKLPTQTCVTFSASINWKEKGCKVIIIFATNTRFAADGIKEGVTFATIQCSPHLQKNIGRLDFYLKRTRGRSKNIGFHLSSRYVFSYHPFPQRTHYFWRVFRFLFMERKQDYNVTSVKNVSLLLKT